MGCQTSNVCWEGSVSAQEGTGQGDLRHHCACPGVGPSACIPSSQAGSPCTPGFPITLLGCLDESHAWFHVPLSASPYQKGGGGWGHSPVTQPPQWLHLLLQPTSCWFWRWCQPRAARGSGVRLPSAGGEPGAQRLPASCRGDGAGAVPGAFAPGWQPHPGQVQCPRGLLRAPLSECPVQPETGMRKL